MIITIALIEMEKSNIKLYIQWVTNDISFRIFDIHEVSNYFKEFVNGLPCFEFNLDSKWQHTGNKMNKAKCTHTQNEYQENNQLNVSFKSKINFRNDRISIGSIFWAYLYCYYCFFSYVSYWWQFFFFFHNNFSQCHIFMPWNYTVSIHESFWSIVIWKFDTNRWISPYLPKINLKKHYIKQDARHKFIIHASHLANNCIIRIETIWANCETLKSQWVLLSGVMNQRSHLENILEPQFVQ